MASKTGPDPTAAQLVISDEAYLQNPQQALEQMRRGVDVVIEPTNGCARMHLSATLLSDIDLDK